MRLFNTHPEAARAPKFGRLKAACFYAAFDLKVALVPS
jgi:hypothetical protein